MGEWVGGVTGVSDVSGPVDQVGTTYVVHFGPVKRPPEVLISAISSRIFSRGSYEGSFRGELEKFAPLAESSPR